jgi:hypothetical protein
LTIFMLCPSAGPFDRLERPFVSSFFGHVAGVALGALAATTVQLLPKDVDITIVLTGAGLGTLLGTAYGAVRGDDTPAQRGLQWSLYGAALAALALAFALMTHELPL